MEVEAATNEKHSAHCLPRVYALSTARPQYRLTRVTFDLHRWELPLTAGDAPQPKFGHSAVFLPAEDERFLVVLGTDHKDFT